MNKFYQVIWFLSLCLTALQELQAQCNINSNIFAYYAGAITPTTSWQTNTCVFGGDYMSFTATAGQVFNFSFCAGGGNATWDTQITINNASLVNVGALGYNDDFCGNSSQLTWTAPSAGTYYVYVNEYNCQDFNYTCSILAYNTTTNVSSGPCNITAGVSTYQGYITPTNTWQQVGCVWGGDYYAFTAVAGQVFNFSFCSLNGGFAGWNTEITINNQFFNNVGAAGFNDDSCGQSSQLTWTAPSAGTYYIYVTQFGCNINATCATLAYQTTLNSSSGPCNISGNVNATNAGTIVPSTNWQAIPCIIGGQYFAFNATAGTQYTFSFCVGGGSATWDTEISINNSVYTVPSPLAYNDDYCGLQSQLSWTPSTSGTYYVFVTQYGCIGNATCAQLAYQIASPPPPTAIDVQTGGNNSDPSYLVQNVFLTGCVQVNNISFNGSSSAIGYFTNGASIGIPSGIILSSGAVTNAEGPNNSPGAGSNLSTIGDADLTAAANSPTYDAAVLTFNFIPTSTAVEFQYVFASEEYLEYVFLFNDVFGFYISGPGIPFQNIALVPGSGIPVSIDNINNVVNSAYYNNNPSGSIITQFDGYTDVLTATVSGLIPCQTYTIKLAVADANDHILDSAVFLAANSFDAGSSATVSSFVPSTSSQNAYEGCGNGQFTFTRTDITDLTSPVTIPITVSGTATPGTDYAALPANITIPAGQASVTISVVAYTDAFAEGSESVIVTVNALLCNCTNIPAATLNILDPNLSAVATPTATTCGLNNGSVSLTATGFTSPTYTWSNGATTQNLTNVAAGTYTVTITGGGCTATANSTVITSPAPTATATPTATTCGLNNGSISLTTANFTSPTYSWSNGATTQNLTNVAAGTYTVTVTGGGCTRTASATIATSPTPTATATPTATTCGLANGSISLTTANITSPTYSWSNGATTQNLTNVAAGTYTVTVTGGGCTRTASATIATSPIPTATAIPTATTCGLNNGSISLSTANFTSPTYSWSNGATTQNLTNVAAGTYTVTVTGGGCTATATATIATSPIPTATAIPTATTCGLNNGSISLSTANFTSPTYSWTNGATTQNITNVAAGTYTVTVTGGGCTATATATVAASPTPSATATPTATTCGLSNGSISLSTANFTSPTYSWSNGATTQNLTNVAAGTYTVTVTGGGCTRTASATIATSPIPTATAIPTATTCGLNNGSISLSTSNFTSPTYSWSNGATTQNSTNVAAGTYTVTVTGGGCTATASATVAASPTPTATATPTATTCGLANGSISLTTTNFTSPTYSWSNGATTQNITNVAAGTYTVTVTGGGCTATASATIATSPTPTATATPMATTCGLANGSISLTTANFTSPTYSWSNGATTQNLTNVAAGTYTVTVTGGGCTATATATVAASPTPTATAIPTATTCGLANSSISLTTANFTSPTYSWSNGATTQNLTNVAAGTYTVTVTGGGCTATATATVATSPTPTATATPTATTCGLANGSISLTTANFTSPTYSWSNGATTQNLTNVAAGTYTVTVTGGGCTATASATVAASPTPTATATPTATSCGLANGSISLTTTNFTSPTYSWSNGAATQNLTNVAAGTYTVTVTGGGCTATATATVAASPTPTATAIPTATTCGLANGSISLTTANFTSPTYSWSNGATTQNLTNVAAGTYTVTVTGGGCTATASATVAAS
ncbi:hypothetical protein B6N25_03675, partial [Sphingobacteriales bacterium TSM_CSS]